MPMVDLFAAVRLRVPLALFSTLLVAFLSAFFLDSSRGLADPLDAPATPILAWAGQRAVIEHYWGDDTGACPDFDSGAGDPDEFGVLYERRSGAGSFSSGLSGNPNEVDIAADSALVDVNIGAVDENFDGRTDPNSACVSRIVYESQDQGKVEIAAFAVDDDDDLGAFDVRSAEVAFVIYFMKLEEVTLGFVPGSRAGENSGDFTATTPPVYDRSNDVTSITSNSSADVLARARVRGWVVADGCPARPAGLDSNGAFLPADRCVFPDDWEFIAGGVLAEEARPDFDIMKAPDSPFLANTSGCESPDRAAGPFSRLDRALIDLSPVMPTALCGDSLAPHVQGSFPCRFGALGGCRESVFPDGDVDSSDAPMPPALVRLLLTGAGYMKGADKASAFTGNSNPFYVTHVPAEPWITPINADLTGYQWNTWGTGSKSGVYRYWTSFAETGPEVLSCPGASPCPGDETATGGYSMIKIYSDNHGEAMAWVNGDANLIAGSSSLNAVADYPDKRKHFAVASNTAEIHWTDEAVGGITELRVSGGEDLSAAGSGASSGFPYALLASGLGACAATLAAGAWGWRRRRA